MLNQHIEECYGVFRKGLFYLQFGMLIPAGIPLLPNPNTSSEVKSGLKNLSFS